MDSIPAILDGLDDRGIPARAAEGQSTSRTAVMELLSAVADCLDRAAGEPPLYSAIARLIRHPDLAPLLGNSINRLDRYFEDHLPWRMRRPPGSEVEGAGRLFDLLDGIAGLTDGNTEKFPDGISTLLLRVYGKRRLNRNTAEGRPLIHALESVCAALDELEAIPAGGKPLPGESRQLRNLRRELMNRGFAAVVRAWVRTEEFRRHCTAHDQLRCEQLIEVARDFDRRGPVRPSEFVAHVRTRRVERPGGSAIRVMSIHVSKGLEFEAVILLDLDARKGHGGDAAVVQVGGEWHVVPSKEKATLLDLEHVRDARVRRDFSEELSVLCVGMTRARSFLDIVLREKSNTPIGTLLRTALRPESGQVAEQHRGLNARDCDAASGRGRSDLRPRDPGIADQEIAILPLPGPAPKDLRPVHVTPSSREDEGTVLVSRILKPSNRSAMRRGELIHAWLSQISWIADGLPSPASLLSATGPLRAHVTKAEATALAAGLLAQINDTATDLHRALSRALFAATADVELWTERRFAVIDDGAELVTGCFDRVVIWRDSTGKAVRAHILDFKTDGFRDAAERRIVEDRYRPQLAAYTGALQKLLPAAKVESSLCFIAP